MFKLTQETIAIVTVGLALAGLDVTSDHAIRSEMQDIRSEMQAMRAEARADREAWQTEARATRAESQAGREAIRAESQAGREAFEKHITRLTQEQSKLTGVVEQMRTASSQ